MTRNIRIYCIFWEVNHFRTFGKDGKSTDFRYIRYNDWQTINGLVMPKSISWYNYENNIPTDLRNTLEFKDVVLSEEAPKQDMFMMEEGDKLIE